MTRTIRGTGDIQSFLNDVASDFTRVPFVPFMRDELRNLAVAHDFYFQAQVGPDGVAWVENADSTIQRKGHDRILFGHPSNRQRLYRSLTRKTPGEDAVREIYQVGDNIYLSFGTDVPYHAVNDEGTSVIPSRRHIGVPTSYVERFAARATDYAFEKLRRSA